MSSVKSPGWVRGVEIGLGVLAVILSIVFLTFPVAAFLSVVWILAVILIFVGIEKIITGIFLPGKARWPTIGLGVLVLIFAGLVLAFPGAALLVITIFIGIALLFNGIARVVEGVGGSHSGWSRFFLIGVGILAIVISFFVLASPLFGAALVGTIIAIGLLITGIQMIATGVAGRKLEMTGGDISR